VKWTVVGHPTLELATVQPVQDVRGMIVLGLLQLFGLGGVVAVPRQADVPGATAARDGSPKKNPLPSG